MKTLFKIQVTVLAVGVLAASTAVAQQTSNLVITNSGVSPASNTFRSFNESSLTRDSEIQNALDLLEDFYPSITVSWIRHDNVRRRNNSQESDTKLTIEPSIDYRHDFGRHKLFLSASGELTRHDEFDQEDAEALALRGGLTLDISKRFDLNLRASVMDTFEERGVSGSRTLGSVGQINNIDELDEGPDEVSVDTIGADLVYGRGISRLNAVVGIEKTDVEFDNNFQGSAVGPFADRNRQIDTIHLDLSYELGARLRVFGRFENSDIDYERESSTLDAQLDTYLLGVRYAPSARLNGVVGIGKQDKDFDLDSREDYDGSTYYGNLNYAIRPYSVLSFNASKLVEEPGDDSSDFFVSKLVGVSWSHALSERWSLGAYIKKIDDEFNNGRQDDFDDLGLNVEYIWRRWLTAGLRFGRLERDSNRPEIPYEDEYFGITIRSDLRR